MQTFVPSSLSYRRSMQMLDNKRLGNQVYREGKTLLSGGWKNHPASKMWAGYHYSLCHYCKAGAEEMYDRTLDGTGCWKPDVATRWIEYFDDLQKTLRPSGRPAWFGNRELHDSHKSNLLRKDYDYYSQFNWDVPDDLPYFWPIMKEIRL